ncbi:MoaF-related domain-containing protein [Nocardia huaxiensis]|uniref:MoaF-related domain-containing protein n=1 Tax=Nocardia huaxiensis TaxID=2755382 RepID=UPI001E515DEC|nr:MoaF N-terminal domain-containing protein [Nocardia huaxiensis]UFS96300.1 MoaF N-terminal domain-containing protein [Nocardia huaxiensis]
MRRTVGSLLFAAAALGAVGCVANPPAPQKVSVSESVASLGRATLPDDLHGRTVQLTYDSGAGGTLTFAADGSSLTYVAADSGRKTVAPAAIESIGAGSFLVTWADEDSGVVISQVQDYRTGQVTGTWSRRAEGSGPFTIQTRTGSVSLTD